MLSEALGFDEIRAEKKRATVVEKIFVSKKFQSRRKFITRFQLLTTCVENISCVYCGSENFCAGKFLRFNFLRV